MYFTIIFQTFGEYVEIAGEKMNFNAHAGIVGFP